MSVTVREGGWKPERRRVPRQGRSAAALGTPVRCEQLRCLPQGYATGLVPNNKTSVMFKFIPNLVYLASVSQRNHV